VLVEVVVGSVVAAVVLFGLVTTTIVRVSRERLARAWTAVEAAVDARAAVAGRMAAVVAAYAGDGPEVTELAARAAAKPTAAVRQRQVAELALVATLRRTFTLVVQYPELEGDPEFRGLQGQLDAAQGRIESSMDTYARSARRLNRRVKTRTLRAAATMLRCPVAPDFDAGDPLARR
jgi:hypothetical protein